MNAHVKNLTNQIASIESLMRLDDGHWKGGVQMGLSANELRQQVTRAKAEAKHITALYDELDVLEQATARLRNVYIDAKTHAATQVARDNYHEARRIADDFRSEHQL
jgi:hypothetical protein